jgi:hypothetical protein
MHEHDHPRADGATGTDNHERPTAGQHADSTTEPISIGEPATGPTTGQPATAATTAQHAAPHANGGAQPGNATEGSAHATANHAPQPPANGQPTVSWSPPVDPAAHAAQAAPPGWGESGPNGYPYYHQPAVPGYGAPVYGPPPVQPPAQPQPQGGGGQGGLIIALAGLIAALLLGAGVAVIMVVSGSDKEAHPATTATAPRTVTTVIKERTVRARSTRSTGRRSSSSTRSSRPLSTRRRSSGSSASSSSSSPTVARAAIKSMLQRHFANIRDGNYGAAFADLGASLGQSQSSWIADIRADGLTSFHLSVAPQITSATSAVANIVSFHTEAEASGCKDWSGSWNVVKSGGRWLISESNLSQTVVSCGE